MHSPALGLKAVAQALPVPERAVASPDTDFKRFQDRDLS
jgi:hypothetical protein